MSTTPQLNYNFVVHPDSPHVGAQDDFWSFGLHSPTVSDLLPLLGDAADSSSPLDFIHQQTGRNDITFSNDPTSSEVELTIQFCYANVNAQHPPDLFFVQGYSGTGLVIVRCPNIQHLNDAATANATAFPHAQLQPNPVRAYRLAVPAIGYCHVETQDQPIETPTLTAHTILDPLGFTQWISQDANFDEAPQLLQVGKPSITDTIVTPRKYVPDPNAHFTYTVHTLTLPRDVIAAAKAAGTMNAVVAPLTCVKGSGTYPTPSGAAASSNIQVALDQIQQVAWLKSNG